MTEEKPTGGKRGRPAKPRDGSELNMGTRGPIPKRSSERVRPDGIDQMQMLKINLAELDGDVEIPAPEEHWEPLVRDLYLSLAQSGQMVYYEPSDWHVAKVIFESLDRDLKPQVAGVEREYMDGEVISERIRFAKLPVKGASLAAYQKAMASLMMLEGDRRRLRAEIERSVALPAGVDGAKLPEGVADFNEARDRLTGNA